MSQGVADNENERRVIAEFLEELRDSANALQVLVGNLRSRSIDGDEGLATLRHTAGTLRTNAQAVGLPLVKQVSHRLEEYVADLRSLSDAALGDIQVFIDHLEKLADGESPNTTESQTIAAAVRSLPAKRPADIDFGNIEQKNVEVLLVIPEKAMSRIVERELAACGYRSSVARDPFEALETVVLTRPDMVIAAMELPGLSGVDMGSALAAMSVTQSIPFAVLTSYAWGHPKLAGLPPRAALIRKGAQFGDDLAESLARFNIT